MESIINFLKRPFCKHEYIMIYSGITIVGETCWRCGKKRYIGRFNGEARK